MKNSSKNSRYLSALFLSIIFYILLIGGTVLIIKFFGLSINNEIFLEDNEIILVDYSKDNSKNNSNSSINNYYTEEYPSIEELADNSNNDPLESNSNSSVTTETSTPEELSDADYGDISDGEQTLTQISENTYEVKAKRNVNQDALFPKSSGSSSGSSSGAAVTSNADKSSSNNSSGSPKGTLDGTNSTEATGLANGVFIKGRKLISPLIYPQTNRNKEGVVRIDIYVDSDGLVFESRFNAKNSTTTDATLVEASLKSSKTGRFDVSKNTITQGYILFYFKNKE